MDTAVRTPLEIFNLPQHLVVPLFQRPYVWDLEEQWEPLWGDIRRLAELKLAQPTSTATHFLGAVVMQAEDNQVGQLQPRSVIDGQQRLTTLQLIADATASVLEELGLEDLAAQLDGLVHNAVHFVQGADTLKLQHTNRDRDAFLEVMHADPPIDYESLAHRKSRVVRAHQYFAEQVAGWVGTGDPTALRARATTLTMVMTRALQIVVIDLRADENSQEIFETLNARGTPLTAADLIKNLVFQRLAAEGVDIKVAFEKIWPFETIFWEAEVSAGRYRISRSSLYLNQWLVSRLGEEIGPTSTFTRFKHYIEHEAGRPMSVLLADIGAQAATYQHWIARAADPHADLSPVELFVYRTQTADIEAVKPVLLWLHQHDRNASPDVINAVVGLVESWVMRRTLMRLPTSGLVRVVADLIAFMDASAPDDLVDRVEGFLRRQDAIGTYWPDDRGVRGALQSEQAYRRFRRGRLRVFLEAAEDQLRGYAGAGAAKAGMRVPRVGYPIEHILPQKWAGHWSVDDLAAEIERNAHVHRFGNLTLLTAALNSSVSNGPWDGPVGKRTKLAEHDVFLLNRNLRLADEWDEVMIDARTNLLVDALLTTWPVPAGHVSEVASHQVLDATSVGVKELVAAGLLLPGTVLRARPGAWGDRTCEVLENCDFRVDDGSVFSSPSAAGHHIRQAATNGWYFWGLPDGRRLKDLRAQLLAQTQVGRSDPS